MLFNSIEFAIFLPIVFVLYWFVTNRNIKFQNILIIAASYLFYGWWDWRFLSLIVFSSSIDFFVGLRLKNCNISGKRKALLWLSILVNLGFLGFFKYFNFFAESFANAFTLLCKPIEAQRLNIILPVGISFYTFQTLSYTIDVYKRKLEPTRDIFAFFAFVSFFPQLVAGPIERAVNLLPQFYSKRKFCFENGIKGLHEIMWGLFKKIVIADNLAYYVNTIYGDVHGFSGLPLFWASLFFSFQIYCDFSGYSSIAIGTARLFGFELMINFKRPYLSTSFTEFWRRWHISLSTWFRDYVYIPIGGNRRGTLRAKINVLVTFLVSGFWHGANWTFIAWGGAHGMLNLFKFKKVADKVPRFLLIAIVFFISILTWVLFRAENFSDAIYIYQSMFDLSNTKLIGISTMERLSFLKLFGFVFVLFVIDFVYEYQFIRKDKKIKYNTSFIFTILLMIAIYIFGAFEQQEFIYFQF